MLTTRTSELPIGITALVLAALLLVSPRAASLWDTALDARDLMEVATFAALGARWLSRAVYRLTHRRTAAVYALVLA